MYIIYHNNKCSKSCKVLSILSKKSTNVKVIDYLINPPTFIELEKMLVDLNISAKEFIRNNEKKFDDLNLINASEQELIKAMTMYPILIQRPIVISKKGIVICRPVDNVLQIL